MRLVFFGGGRFAALVLERLVVRNDIVQVITPPPMPAQRGMRHRLPPAAAVAQRYQLPLIHAITPDLLRTIAAPAVVCDYGRLLPPVLLAAAPGFILNIHPSLLPRWRGAAPIERAVLAGDSKIGVTIMALNEKLDQGDVLAQQTVASDQATAEQLYPLLAATGADLLQQVIAAPEQYPPQPQDGTQATYAAKITAADRLLDFKQSAAACRRQIMALTPKPGAHFFIGNERLRVLAAEVRARPAAKPGTLLAADQTILIACGRDALDITCLQRAGRNPMASADFLRGYSLAAYVGRSVGSPG